MSTSSPSTSGGAGPVSVDARGLRGMLLVLEQVGLAVPLAFAAAQCPANARGFGTRS